MITSRLSFFIGSLSLIALLGAGCGTTTPSNPTNSTNPLSGMQATDPQGTIGTNVTIPSDYPTDLPRYPQAATLSALHDGESYTITQQTTDPIDTVVQALNQQLISNGYTATMHLGSAGEALQITDYTNTTAKAMVRIQVSTNPATKNTVALIVRSEANP